tara:strand:- start:312 stop:638 length:327 start_codon:yes stop_codon:yes gene_type:complete
VKKKRGKPLIIIIGIKATSLGRIVLRLTNKGIIIANTPEIRAIPDIQIIVFLAQDFRRKIFKPSMIRNTPRNICNNKLNAICGMRILEGISSILEEIPCIVEITAVTK